MPFITDALPDFINQARFKLVLTALPSGARRWGVIDISSLQFLHGNSVPAQFGALLAADIEPLDGLRFQVLQHWDRLEANARRDVLAQLWVEVENLSDADLSTDAAGLVVTLSGIAVAEVPAGFSRTAQPTLTPSASEIVAKDLNNVVLASAWTTDVDDGGEEPIDADTLGGHAGPYYLDRDNHTGQDDIADVNGLQTALDDKADLVAGKVPSAQLPSFVDDVVEASNFAALPGTGETGKIYVTLDDGKTYRWSGSAYAEISASLALGETSSTAYRGDRGKTAYDHSQLVSGNPHAVTKSDVGLGSADNTSDAGKPVSTAQATAIAVVQSDIDAHEADTANPHAVTKSQVGLGSVPNTDCTDAGNISSGTLANARLDTELQAIAGLTSAADKGIQFTGSGAAGTFDLTTAGKAILDDVDAAAQRTTLGLGTAAVTNTGTGSSNTILGNDSRLTDSRAPSGAAGGVLGGTYPNPTFASETGSGATVRATSPTIATPTIASFVNANHSHQDAAGGGILTVAAISDFTSAVQALLNTLDVKQECAYATAAALASNTYSNGSSGVGATLTATANGPLTVDGILLTAGARILVKNEATAANNGVYTLTQQGVVAISPYILTRTTDSDQAAELGPGYLVPVEGPTGSLGVVNNGTLWMSLGPSPFVVGSSSLTFTQEDASGAALKANNLSDLASASAARTNLGLAALAVLSTVGTAQIDNDAVTYAKIQNVTATDKLLGRSTVGAGDVEEIALTAAGRALIDDADAAAQRVTMAAATYPTNADITSLTALLTTYLNETSEPGTPAANILAVWVEDDGNGITRLRYKDDAGNVVTLGRDRVIVVKNTTGGTLSKGTAAYLSGVSSGVPLVAKAKADALATTIETGLILADIANNGFGLLLKQGKLSNFDTSGLTAGQVFYVSAATAGLLTSTQPSSPNFSQAVGFCLTQHATTGTVHVFSRQALGDSATKNVGTAAGTVAAGDHTHIRTLNFVIGDGIVAIAAGDAGQIEVGAGGTITAARLLSDASGSIVVDVQKATYSGLPTFSSIAASAKPTLSSAQKSQDSTLTGWTTALAAGDWLNFHVDSATTVKKVTISLTVTFN